MTSHFFTVDSHSHMWKNLGKTFSCWYEEKLTGQSTHIEAFTKKNKAKSMLRITYTASNYINKQYFLFQNNCKKEERSEGTRVAVHTMARNFVMIF